MKRTLIIVFVALAGVAGSAAHAAPPDGYRVTGRERITDGVEHLTMTRSAPDIAINIAHVEPDAPVALRTVSSYDSITGNGARLERTTSMCERVRCLVAVNGDFFRENLPVGAVASDGGLLRSPNPKHHQVIVTRGGRLRAGPLRWKGTVVATDLRRLRLDAVNRDRGRNDLVAYTRAYGSSTGTNPFGAELVLRFPRAVRALPIGQTVTARAVRLRYGKGDTPMDARTLVLSGHGREARALQDLWKAMRSGAASRELLVRVETDPSVAATIGGTPVLLRDGAVWFSNDDNDFVRSRHPRTLVGWNRKGDVWLVTVDGRQPGYSSGASLSEAAALMRGLGATDAINLDGGGSSTFVVAGGVANRPSDRLIGSGAARRIVHSVSAGVPAANVERPVANALVIVPAARASLPAGHAPRIARAVPPPEVVDLPAPAGGDPASDPRAGLPAVVGVALPVAPADARGIALAFAGLLNGAAASAVAQTLRRRSRHARRA